MSASSPPTGRGLSWIVAVSLLAACEKNELGHASADGVGDMRHAPAPRGRFDQRQREACGRGGPTTAAEHVLLRRPYLQKVTTTTAEVLWTATELGEISVTGLDGTPAGSVSTEVDRTARLPRGTQYVARISGLLPGSTYCYALNGERGEVLYETTGFGTAPDPGRRAPVRFIALGDLGKRTSDQSAVLSSLQTVPFDFGLIAGDLAYDDGKLEEFERNYFEVYAKVIDRAPFFTVSGNHEYETDDAAPFRQVFSLFENGGPQGDERWYSFDWGDVHFVALDTEQVGEAQVQWLEQDLASNERPWVVAVAHRPPWSSGRHGSDESVREAFHPVFVEHGVQLVVTGHDHHYERTKPMDGVTYVVTGGGGRGTRKVGRSEFTAHADQVAHFVYVLVEHDTLRLHAIDAAGDDFDSLELRLE